MFVQIQDNFGTCMESESHISSREKETLGRGSMQFGCRVGGDWTLDVE